MSVLDKLKALDEERAKLLEEAKKEALEAAHKAVAALNELGFPYRLVEEPQTAPRATEGLPEVPKAGTKASNEGCPLSNLRV